MGVEPKSPSGRNSFLQNRRILKYLNAVDNQNYQDKNYDVEESR